jgi:hypothetical protein
MIRERSSALQGINLKLQAMVGFTRPVAAEKAEAREIFTRLRMELEVERMAQAEVE